MTSRPVWVRGQQFLFYILKHNRPSLFTYFLYIRIHLFTCAKVVKNNNFLVKNGLLMHEFGIIIVVQNEEKYLSRISKDTCTCNT